MSLLFVPKVTGRLTRLKLEVVVRSRRRKVRKERPRPLHKLHVTIRHQRIHVRRRKKKAAERRNHRLLRTKTGEKTTTRHPEEWKSSGKARSDREKKERENHRDGGRRKTEGEESVGSIKRRCIDMERTKILRSGKWVVQAGEGRRPRRILLERGKKQELKLRKTRLRWASNPSIPENWNARMEKAKEIQRKAN